MKRSPLRIVLLLALTAAGVAAVRVAPAQTTRSQGPVTWMELPLNFPVVGNIEAVNQWQMARLQEVQQTATTDLIVTFRLGNGRLVRATGPGPELCDLAFQSDWVRTATKTFPGRTDYAERMVAFDVDGNGRLIAMASLETVNRDRSRLRSALGL